MGKFRTRGIGFTGKAKRFSLWFVLKLLRMGWLRQKLWKERMLIGQFGLIMPRRW